jgi:DNA-binding CsgD family transcriptional regulator/tetratricopeptide (TPR) repeat protein
MGLLERDDQLGALVDRRRRASAGHGGLVLVTGEPGAGKTALVQAFADDPGGTAPVLWGACDPLTTPRPLGPLHDVADLLDEATRRALHGAGQPHTIFAAVHAFLRDTPTVLVVDDLHWADQGTVDLLRFVLRRIGATPSLVVGTVRDEELDRTHPLRALLGDVARSPDADTLRLAPLSEAAIATLAGDRPVDAARIARLSGGNPFFVTELLDQPGEDLPASARDAILARTAPLDEAAWDLLHLLACSPEAVPDQLLPRLGIGLPPLRAVDQAGLIRRGRRGVEFRHDLCRLAVAAAIPPGGDAPVHRRMLDALEADGGADPAVLTHHAVGSGDRWRILRHASAAGRGAARAGAHTQAATFLRTALGCGAPLAAADEADLLESLAEEAYLTDRLDEAIAASNRALHLRARAGDAPGMSGNHHSLAVYHWYRADRVDADDHASDALGVLEGDSGSRAVGARSRRGHALAMQAYLALQANDVDRARRLVARAGAFAPGSDDPTLTVRTGWMDGICSVAGGEPGGREAVLAVLAGAGDDYDAVYSSGYSILTYLDVEQRRLAQAETVLDVSLAMAVERDLPICRVWQMGSRGRLKLFRGDWDAAVADAEEVLAGSAAPVARTWPHLVRGLITMRRGGDGDADLDEAWRLARRYGEAIRLLPVTAALAERAWLRGTDDERLADARALIDDDRVGLDWGRGELAVWHRRLRPDVALADIPDIAEPYALELAGKHRDAADRWAALSCRYERALALVGSDDAEDTRTGLAELDRLGAEPVAARARLDLRARGLAPTAPRRASTRRNPAGLTNRELDVLRLLAGGLTNAELGERLYISPKTVDHHVSSILAKLPAANRRDAGRQARELGLLD